MSGKTLYLMGELRRLLASDQSVVVVAGRQQLHAARAVASNARLVVAPGMAAPMLYRDDVSDDELAKIKGERRGMIPVVEIVGCGLLDEAVLFEQATPIPFVEEAVEVTPESWRQCKALVVCVCELRNRQWDGNGKCLTCGCKYVASERL